MVLVGEKKYACETCIKGHRSSSCKHTDRPLFEIKKKGRPVTQCDHCRELRKTKQVHVKCVCESKEEPEGPKSGLKRGPASATFPSGLPEALEASVALQLLSEGSDSEHGGAAPGNICTCKATGVCNCCTARSSPSRAKRQQKQRLSSHIAEDNTIQHSNDKDEMIRPAGLVVSANTGDYRPLLPRPGPQRHLSSPGPVHDPSTSTHPHANRHQGHAQLFYSPYGRAYESTHRPDGAPMQFVSNPNNHQPVRAESAPSIPALAQQSSSGIGGDSGSSWFTLMQEANSASPDSFPSLCNCGPSCACPGCTVHRGPTASRSAVESCTNPNTCAACLECNILSLPDSISLDASLARYEPPQLQAIDDWIRQMSSVVPSPSPDPSAFGSSAQQEPSSSGPPNQQMRYDPAMWSTYALWNDLQGQVPTQSAPEECCGGNCKCPLGMCTCAADCCGCCQGCECSDCHHEDAPGPSTNKQLTFAVSGERAPCCAGGRTSGSGDLKMQQGILSSSGSASLGQGLGAMQDGGDWRPAYDTSLIVPRTSLSRASSTSSRSSQHTHSSGSQRSVHSVPSVASDVPSCCASMDAMGPVPNEPSIHPGSGVATGERTFMSTGYVVADLDFPSMF